MKCNRCGEQPSTVGDVRRCSVCRKDTTASQIPAEVHDDELLIFVAPAIDGLSNRFQPQPGEGEAPPPPPLVAGGGEFGGAGASVKLEETEAGAAGSDTISAGNDTTAGAGETTAPEDETRTVASEPASDATAPSTDTVTADSGGGSSDATSGD
jgi:hypothetical protein